eukprot:622147-Amphidinium_carterae.1
MQPRWRSTWWNVPMFSFKSGSPETRRGTLESNVIFFSRHTFEGLSHHSESLICRAQEDSGLVSRTLQHSPVCASTVVLKIVRAT